MAFWGMGLDQSDEFWEIYDEYMDLYDIGLEPIAITQQMLNKFSEDSISHNALFAIAKAEWSLGFRSEKIISKVNEIIDNGVRLVTFEGGKQILINFSELDASTSLGTVKAHDYLLVSAE